MGHIKPIRLAPLTPPFPRCYNAHTRCDYHGGNPGHPTENCTGLRRKVQDLINNGKLKFEDLDRSIEVEDPSRVKVEMARQKHGTPREADLEKAAMPKKKVPIVEVRRSEAGSLSTTEGSKERSCEPNRKENECVTTLIKEHNPRTLKRRRTLGSNEA